MNKTLTTVVKVGVILILIVALFMMFVINPHVNNDPYTQETLWEAVHPFRFWDIFGLIGMILFGLYVSGLAGKVVYRFTEPRGTNSAGLVHAVGVASALMMLLFFV